MCLLAAGCRREPQPAPTPGKGANEWIFEQMSEHYLYNDRLKTLADTDFTLSPQDFFVSLLSVRPEDNDGKHPNAATGQDYFYSYLEENVGTRTIGSNVFSYGIDYMFYRFADGTAMLRVLYVARGSVAERAGIRRGDWISRIDTEAVSRLNYRKIENGGPLTLTLGQRDYDPSGGWGWCGGSPRTVSLPAATRLDNSPVYLAEGPDRLGIPGVAYLVYHEFYSGPGGFSDKTFDNELKAAFRTFKQQHVRELILDLRYNPGGYTECCRLLGSLIVPEGELGGVFAINKYNASRQATQNGSLTQYFLKPDELGGANLNLSRLWVITGMHTASSSELLINALSPYMEVFLVGSPTEGKNVGSYEIASAQHSLSLHPITFQAYNCLERSDYKHGFTPQYPLDELFAPGDGYRPMKELGDPRELLLARTLSLMGYRPASSPAAMRTARSVSAPAPRVVEAHSSIEHKPVRGMMAPMPDCFRP